MNPSTAIPTDLSLCFLGVGNARATALGSASAVLERAHAPRLLIDCGPRTLDDFQAAYGLEVPPAVFITHLHMDHIGGLEQLFYRAYFSCRGAIRVYVPADLIAGLHAKLANAPFILSEGGANFWDAFTLVPVGDWFWCDQLLFNVFPVRHSGYRAAFGLALPGAFFYSSDTRPIPEILAQFAAHEEPIFHDCGLHASPAHTGLEDVLRDYSPALRARLIAYHYESAAAGAAIGRAGLRVAQAGPRYALRPPLAAAWAVQDSAQRAAGQP